MTALDWALPGSHMYETGLDRGVFFPMVGPGVAWPGLVSVEEAVSGGDLESYYYDGIKYLDVILGEDFSATLTAFQAPYEFLECDGYGAVALGLFVTQQPRKIFNLAYRTKVGNDLTEQAGYKLHLVWNCTVSPTGRTANTKSADPTMTSMAWTINTVPPYVAVTAWKPTAHMIIDTRYAPAGPLADLEDQIYGTPTSDPILPDQQGVLSIFS